ncbi:terpenoid synthase [Epithele typhae]|uniref:terpenoid synthase n=1 Tax=Epithele typhae TaxID=378194 RepID=UPI0020074CBD|nr:terpenoid synthase [Epithele typhae]KAH9940450.1 terpenoid synthase [Epithele typhae]
MGQFTSSQTASLAKPSRCDEDAGSDPHAGVKTVVREFLARSDYRSPKSLEDPVLRSTLADELATWPASVPPSFIAKVLDGACVYTETAYAHVSHAHKLYIARYTACMLYVDDLAATEASGVEGADAVRRFAGRFVRGEPQPDAVLDALAAILRDAHTGGLWGPYGADAIVAGTLDAIAAAHVEGALERGAIKVHSGATMFPSYLRTRAGIGPPFTHFAFMREWRDVPDSYLQVLPYMEHWTLGTNLSFYKEELAGETKNYVHLRADAELRSCEEVLLALSDEVAQSARRMDTLVKEDVELEALWRRYYQGYLEFSLKAKRYRLAELGYEP